MSSHAHQASELRHEHVFLSEVHNANERRTRWVIALNVVMMIGEIGVGYVSGSMALLADGFHMATHAGALTVAAMAYAFARTRADDPAFAFGTGKVGDLAGFASALALGLLSLAILVESAERLFAPQHIQFGEATLVAALGLVVNMLGAWLLSGGHHHGDGHVHHHDNNIRSAYLHLLADGLTSLLAIGALLAGRYFGWVILDPVIGIVGALVIARWSWGLMRDTAQILLDRVDEPLTAEVRRRIEADGDAQVADLHVWRIAPGKHAGIVSLIAADPESADDYRRRLADLRSIVHLSIEVHRCVAEH